MVTKIIKRWRERRRKIKYFRHTMNGLLYKAWHQEFTKDQMMQVKEGFRVEYDRLQELADACETRIKSEREKADPDKTIIDQMTKSLEKFRPDIDQLKKQMEGINEQLDGPKGINPIIENYYVAISNLREYIKKL